MTLPETWDAWLQSLHGDRRYRVKKIRKKLNAAHPARASSSGTIPQPWTRASIG